MKFISLLSLIVFISSVEAFGQEAKVAPNHFEKIEVLVTPQNPSPASRKITEKNCSPINEGLLFCTNTPEISGEKNQPILVELSLENTSEKTINVIYKADFFLLYEVSIIDPSGKKLPTRDEELALSVQEGKIPVSKEVDLPINNLPQQMELPAHEKINRQYELNRFYDFKLPGTYQIKITRKINQNSGKDVIKLPLPSIEVKIF